jgi:hypothetical protein
MGNEGASGLARMHQVWSPFGVSLTTDGQVSYELTVVVRDLPAAGDGESHHVWLATKSLDRIRHLGSVESTDSLTSELDWSQFLVVVSRESEEVAGKWAGPVVLRGHSPGSLIRPLWGHPIFQQTPM